MSNSSKFKNPNQDLQYLGSKLPSEFTNISPDCFDLKFKQCPPYSLQPPVNPMPKRSIHTLKSVLLIYSNTKAGVFDWKREQWFFLDTQTVINAICIGPPSNLTDKKDSFIRDCLRISFFRFVIYFCACVCPSETREGIRHPGAGVLGGREDLNWNECWNLNSGPLAEQHAPSSVLSNFSSPKNLFVVIVVWFWSIYDIWVAAK